MAWGYHLILDCADCNDSIRDDGTINKFLADLVKEIKMEPVGEPIITYLLPKTPNAGYSAFQLIQTSNITAHFVDLSRQGYIDIFSCKEFEKDVAISIVQKWFNPTSIKQQFLERNA